MAGYELLESHPDGQRPPRRHRRTLLALLVLLALLAGGAVALLRQADPGPAPDSETATCRAERGAIWCTEPSEALTDPALVRLVHGYCPRLRVLKLHQVRPQPLHLLALAPGPDDLVRRTGGRAGLVESALLGQPGRLAWVVSQGDPSSPARLRITCPRGSGRVPALHLDGDQLSSALAAAAGDRALDLRQAARSAAVNAHVDPARQMSLGSFRCRTGQGALALRPGARFTCELQVFSALGQGGYRETFRVARHPPHLRLMS